MSAQQALGVRVRLVEPIMLRGCGEFGPGSWVRGASLILPTTLYGALAHRGWLLDRRCSECMDRWEALRRCLTILLRSEAGGKVGTAELRGPVLVAGDRVFIGCAEGLAELNPKGVVEWVRRQDMGERPGKRTSNVPHEFIGLGELLSRRTGIGLAKVSKVVEEGLIYTAPYTDYKVGKVLKLLASSCRKEVFIAADIITEAKLSASKDPIPLRLGGEDRKALAYLGGPYIMPTLEDYWKGVSGNAAILVLATPLILDDRVIQTVGLGAMTTGEDLDMLILKTVEKIIENFGKVSEARVYSVHPRVRPRVTLLQLGFDERLRRKSSLNPALMPGAAFKVRLKARVSWRDLYVGARSYLSDIGFGTFLPIPALS